MFSRLILRMKDSIWLMPALCSLGALITAICVITADYFLSRTNTFFTKVFVIKDSLAQVILSTIAGSLLTMTTITFSTIMVVLTTYSSQFSPRTLQNFLRDPVTMRVLGIFIGGFVYSIFTLLFMSDGSKTHNITASLGVGIAIICVAFFAYFIHHVSVSIQVSQLIEKLTDDILDTIKKIRELKQSIISENHTEFIPNMKKTVICAPKYGYIQLIDFNGLLRDANENGYYIQVHKPMGNFLSEDEVCMTIFHEDDREKIMKKGIVNKLTIGNERTTIQDVEFGLQKLTEIALRAISPGINDPNTAIDCIRHLGIALKAASKIDGKYLNLQNDKGKTVLSFPHQPFEDLLRSSFFQICYYGQSDISIIEAILQALYMIAEENTEGIVRKIITFSDYVIEQANIDSLSDFDKQRVNRLKMEISNLHMK